MPQTFSFSRLAWRILQETGGVTRHHLSSTGIQMMLRKLVEQYKHEFKVFTKASDKNGFIEQLEAMLNPNLNATFCHHRDNRNT